MNAQKQHLDATFKADCSTLKNWPGNDLDGMSKFRAKIHAEAYDYRVFLKKYYYFFSAEYYNEGLPNPVTASKSDADGRFTISVPQDETWILSAYGNRLVGEKKENYLWITKITPAQIASSQVLLSNDNMISSNNPDSMIGTLPAETIKNIISTINHNVDASNVDDSNIPDP